MFERHSIETFHADRSGSDQLSQRIFPDLLVLDGTAGCDGFAVVDWLRQHNRLRRCLWSSTQPKTSVTLSENG